MAPVVENNTQPPTAKKRRAKELPDCLLFLNETNVRTQVKARLETDAKETAGEAMVAYAVTLADGGEGGDSSLI